MGKLWRRINKGNRAVVSLIFISLIVGLYIGATRFTTVLNPTGNVTWKDSTGTQIDLSTTQFVNGQSYTAAVTASPFSASDDEGRNYVIGEIKIEVCDSVTLSKVSTFTWKIPQTFKSTDAISSIMYSGASLSRTIAVTVPSAPKSYVANVFTMYYAYTITSTPYEPGVIPVSTWVFDYGTSLGWYQVYGEKLDTKIASWTWRDSKGTVIPDIASATISGTIECSVTVAVASYSDSAATWTLEKTFVNIYQRAGNTYSETAYKQNVGVGSNLNYTITVDTTQLPNGQYKFLLGTSWISDSGTRVATLSIFYSTFENGEGLPSAVPGLSETQILMIIAVLALASLFILYLVRRRRR